MQIRIPKKGFAIFSIVVIFAVAGITLYQTGIPQIFSGHAQTVSAQWEATESAATACNSQGDVIINVSFTNQETTATQIMIVTATDQQTQKSVDLGTIDAGKTATGTINTGLDSLKSGTVVFTMAWSYDTSVTDTQSANYPAVSNCPSPSPTPTLTPVPPSPTPTGPITPYPSASPTVCPTPGTVTNIQIQCPYCTPSPTSSP